MFALEVEYLTGRAVATERHARERAEWPPHPGRLFSALVDAAFQATSPDGTELPDAVRKALEWLERLTPPAICAGEARRRVVIQSFVPVNDSVTPEVKAGKVPSEGQVDDAVAMLPDRRGRQPRFFPTVVPDHAVVHFVWQDAPPEEVAEHRPALDEVARAVTYLGHSSSLVRVALTATPPTKMDYTPDNDGGHTFRVPSRGRLTELCHLFARQARPTPGHYAAYRKEDEVKPPPAVCETVYGDVIVCQIRGPHLPVSGTIRLTRAVRAALISLTDKESNAVKTLVSGHTPDKDLAREEHVAYLPLANVGFNRFSDGKVMGFGVVLPRKLNKFSGERRAVVRAVAELERVWFADGTLHAGATTPGLSPYEWLVAMPGDDAPQSLQTWAYTGPSKLWATVTPVLMDRHGGSIEHAIAASVRRQFPADAQPEIVNIEVGPVSWHLGVPPSHEFPHATTDAHRQRHRTHALVEFGQDVRGPLLVGAGRYFGLGLFRQWTPPEGRR